MQRIVSVMMIVGMVVMAGCGQRGISTARLEKSFKGSERAVETRVQNIVKAVEAKNYAGAVAELQKLGAQANLTEEQRAAIKDLVEQAQKELTAAIERKAADVQKALGK